MILPKIQLLYNSINIFEDTIDYKYKLIYYCGKIEKILQELLETDDDINKSNLNDKYSELLTYCLKVLKHENVNLIDIYEGPRQYLLTNTDVYSLMEYSIKKFDAPTKYIYDKQFKSIIKSIIDQIVTHDSSEDILKTVIIK